MNADGTGVVNLTNHAAVDWSPATSSRGKNVIFTSERDGNGHLYVLSADGELRRITNTPGYDAYASWSPRGNDIVFVREGANGSDLYTVHADGTQERRLTSSPGQTKFFPTFSPDGEKVAYSVCMDPPAPENPNPTCSTHVLELATGEDVDLALPGVNPPNPFVDDFGAGRDVELWNVIHDGKGASIDWTNGRVEITFAPDAQAYPGSTQIGVHTAFHCVLLGDFDATVNYELLEWPAANNVLVFLNAFFADASIGRESRPWGEQYAAFIAPNFGSAVTMDQSGSFRLVRAGGVMTASYRQDGEWVTLASAPASSDPAIIALVGAADSGTFAAQPVKVAFDNFRLDAAPVTRDCSSHRPDLNPDWQAITEKDDDEDDD
jgi:dipeptidyl aminopeptidase/acylaminoacyl peptidase